jgi:hypothetical protein
VIYIDGQGMALVIGSTPEFQLRCDRAECHLSG